VDQVKRMTASPTVDKNEPASRFEMVTDEGVAVLNYHEGPSHITLVHTEVPKAMEGRGYAGALAKTALEYARAKGIRVIVHCPFVRSYLERHPEYAGLL